MKTWEMIKELTENPEKKFKVKNAEGTVGITDKRLQWIDGTYIDSNEDLIINEIVLHDLEWEEVKEPVSFIEALKSCKRVSVEHPNLFDMPVIYKKNASIATVINYIFESYSDALVREIILNGKWYIED